MTRKQLQTLARALRSDYDLARAARMIDTANGIGMAMGLLIAVLNDQDPESVQNPQKILAAIDDLVAELPAEEEATRG